MFQSKPEAIGKNVGTVGDFAMYFRAKEESLRELNIRGNDKEMMELTTLGMEEHPGGESAETEAATKEDTDRVKMTESPERHFTTPSEYRKLFKNLNNFTEKITRTFEGKIHDMKSDRYHSNRSRKSSGKDNSNLSDSEDQSESAKGADWTAIKEDSPAKSPTSDTKEEADLKSNLESEPELRQRKRTWPIDITKFSEEPTMGMMHVGFVETAEVEPAVEADEDVIIENEEEVFSDAMDTFSQPPANANSSPPPAEDDDDAGSFIRLISNPKNQKVGGIGILLMICAFLLSCSFSPFIQGFLTCFFIFIIWQFIKDYDNSYIIDRKFCIPDYAKLPPLRVPLFAYENGVWFNEYTFLYDPEYYTVSHTFPVYMEIDKSFLILSRPRGKINKRATYDEKKYKLDFINRRVFDLRYCRITLKPEGILRRRYFSKKYPIYIELFPGALIKAVRFKDSMNEEEDIELDEVFQFQDFDGPNPDYGKDYLNLFARCNRQKEEWFRKLLAAGKRDLSDVDFETRSASIEVSFGMENTLYDEYWDYMSTFVVKQAGTDNEEEENTAKSEEEVQWLSAVVNRLLFDVFRTPYWLDKIHSKIQKKLASLRLPFYIEALEVTDMNLGKVGPRFHRISPPVLDDRGLWFDVDMTFEGSFKLTFQTQLNLVKLQRGLEEEVNNMQEEKQEDRPENEQKQRRHKKVEKVPSDISKINSRELLLEFAEIVVSDESNDQNSTTQADGEQSDSIDSEDDEEEEYDEFSKAASKTTITERRRPVRKNKKIFRVMESVAHSKYFKSIAETRYVQKAIAGVSATKLRLVLEIKNCIGTLAINLPPPPLDRVWFGFRNMPQIWMTAHPIIGHKSFGFPQIRHFFERKIMEEIKKIIVLPNMDDLLLPIPPKDYEKKEYPWMNEES